MSRHSRDQRFPAFWEQTGLSSRQSRILELALLLLLLLFLTGWIYTAISTVRRGGAPSIARQLGSSGSPLTPLGATDATFAMSELMDRLLRWEEVRGYSGAVQVILRETGDTLTLPVGTSDEAAITFAAPEDSLAEFMGPTTPARAGIWNVLLRMGQVVREVPSLNIVTLVPSTRLVEGRIGGYRIGQWPRGTGAYAAPTGFVEVTPENMQTRVSEHFQLQDFLTKGQEGVWPKYVVISPRLLDKLELTIQELERRGHPVDNVFVISGFRTPWYNVSGGNPQGRGARSRHMYGDAADIAIDNDGDRCMDDLNGDGKVDIADARVIVEAAEAVEQQYPLLIGGIGIYRPVPGSHCGMVHIDTRGNRARW